MPNAPFTWGPQGPQSLQPGSVQLTNGMFLQNDGPKNYLTYSDAETNATTGWSLGNVALTSNFPSGTPTFGSGASANLSLATSSSSPIAGTYSYAYTSSAATTAGNFLASDAFTIDSADQGKVLTFKFYYTPSSNPTNGNWSGTSSNSFGVAIYDVTTGGSTGWIMPAGVWCMTQSTGVGIATGTFQTTASSTQYRIVVFNANASSGAITLKFDRFFLGPQTIPIGPVVTDWQSYTPTGNWTGATVTYSGLWRRIGDSIEIQAYIYCSGAPPAASLTVNLPSGLSIDTNKMAFTADAIVGDCSLVDNGVQHYDGIVLYSGPSALVLRPVNASSTYDSASANVSSTVPFTWGAGDFAYAYFKVPVTGWSSQVQMSNDTDTRVATMRTTRAGVNQTIAPNNSWVTIEFFAGTSTAGCADTFGSFNPSTYTYSIPVSGYYKLNAQVAINNTNVLNNRYFIAFTDSSGNEIARGPEITPAAGSYVTLTANACSYYFNAGATVKVRLYGVGNNSVNQLTVDGGNNMSYFSVERASGPAVVAASETVAFMGYTNANTGFSGTTITVGYTAKTDSHNAWNGTNTYTIPVSGRYEITAESPVYTNTVGGGNAFGLLYLSGNLVKSIYFTTPTQGSATTLPLTWTNFLVAGTTVQFKLQNTFGGFQLAGSTIAPSTYATLTIKRIGN